MATRNRKATPAPIAALFDGPEDNLTAAKSLLSTLSTTADYRRLNDDEIHYTLAVASRLIDEGMAQYGEGARRPAKGLKAAPGADRG